MKLNPLIMVTPINGGNPFFGKKLVVTWFSDEEEILRATPTDGDPLVSIEFNYSEVRKLNDEEKMK